MKNLFKSIALLLGAAFISASVAQAEVAVYKIDAVHSGVTFKIRHFFTKVPGSFGTFSGEIHFDEKHSDKSRAMATIDLTTVDTNNSGRDKHLQEDDYFDTAKFPKAEFVSTKFEKAGDMKYKIHGELSFLGKTGPVVLDAEFLGTGEGRNGAIISGWDATGTIDRTKWGLTSGGGVLGEEVEIILNIQAKKQ